jgi:hypothetical protein
VYAVVNGMALGRADGLAREVDPLHADVGGFHGGVATVYPLRIWTANRFTTSD